MFRFRLFFIDMPLIYGAILGLFFSEQDIGVILGVVLAELTANFATYFTANVAQKRVISENYVAELAHGQDNSK